MGLNNKPSLLATFLEKATDEFLAAAAFDLGAAAGAGSRFGSVEELRAALLPCTSASDEGLGALELEWKVGANEYGI